MRSVIKWTVLAFCLLLAPSRLGLAATPAAAEPLDYTLLTHTLNLDMLRSGAHSAKGTNSYYFAVTLVGLLNAAEERNLDFEKRKKVLNEVGVFGDTSIESLAAWKPDEKLKDYRQIKIEGPAIRELVAQTMTEFKAPESEVLVQVAVRMMLKKKKYFVLKADEQVAKITYAPIPATKFEAALRTNQDLVIEDDKGTFVKLSVRYDNPVAKPTAKTPK